MEKIPSLAAGLIAERQLTERAPGNCDRVKGPAFVPGRTLRYQHNILQVKIGVYRMSRRPHRITRRHRPASIGAEVLALSDVIGEAQPGERSSGGGVGALVLRL